ncbi:hypothetical protein LTS17_009133 [Exophiala oligosperma]
MSNQSFNRQFPAIDTLNTEGAKQRHNATLQGTIVGLYTLIGTFGALLCTFGGDKIGRRWTTWFACLFNALGAIISASSFTLAQFAIGRAVLGFGSGGIIATVSVWQSELSKASSRGSHVSAFGIFSSLGLISSLWIDYGCFFIKSSASWRIPLAFPVLFAAISMSTIFLIPESPRWLTKMGKTTEAREILHRLHNSDEVVEMEMQNINASLDLSGHTTIKSVFTMGRQRTFHRVVIGMMVQMMLQLTGINGISYYVDTLYTQQLGFSTQMSSLLGASSQFAMLLGALICAFAVDRYGRRTLLIISAGGQSICFILAAALISHPNNKSALDAAVFVLFLYYVIYTVGYLGIPFLYASEIAPSKERMAVAGIATATSWIFNFLVVEVTPVAFTSIHWRYFIVYAVLNALWVPIVYFFFPETSNRSLEEIDQIFAASKSIFDPPRVAKRLPRMDLGQFASTELKDTPVAEEQESVLKSEG